MKIAITGHADGFGKAVADKFAELGHEIVGFSLENGYDITEQEDRLRMIPQIIECDIFINCAYSREVNDLAQCHLLLAVYGEWQRTAKHIINLSSVAPDWKIPRHNIERQVYRGAKAALDTVSDELAYTNKCRVTNIRPDWMKSKELQRIEDAFKQPITKDPLDYADVADLVAYVVDMADRGVTLTSITLRGTRT